MPRKILHLTLIGIGLIIIVEAFYLAVLWNRPPQTDFSAVPARVNFPVPELTLTDIQGVSHSLADYRGQVILVNLWATWCPPCKEEMPALQAFYDKYREDGFVIIAIDDGEPKADVVRFVQEYGLTFPVWLDPTSIATLRVFNAPNLPTSFVIDRNGTIRLTWIGGINYKTLQKYVTPLIREK